MVLTVIFFERKPKRLLSGKNESLLFQSKQKEIPEWIAEGHTNPQIAEKIFPRQVAIDNHRKNLSAKLNVKNTVILNRLAVEHKLIQERCFFKQLHFIFFIIDNHFEFVGGAKLRIPAAWLVKENIVSLPPHRFDRFCEKKTRKEKDCTLKIEERNFRCVHGLILGDKISKFHLIWFL